ncbi:hypothetical protein ACIRBX_03195 [Kitasatospora sp. NPDC096147]|uniref:hypothetical protein n=1 Tax=Kitasatospora sp. NPDC096147 TaxID=3364093 RepID=UPI00380D5650
MQRTNRLLATLAGVAALGALGAGPASAVGAGAGTGAAGPGSPAITESTWNAYPSGAFNCTRKDHRANREITFQSCLLFSNGGSSVQAVLVVDSYGAPSAVTIEGSEVTSFGGDVHCGPTTLNPNFQVHCLGPVRPVTNPALLSATGKLYVNGQLDTV